MIVIGCGSAKRAEASKARDLYVGSLFRAGRRYAEASGRPWLILSAVHGVIGPDVWLRPYDQKLTGSVQATIEWARLASDAIAARLGPGERVELLAGKLYADPVGEELARAGIVAVQPLRGLSLGHRLQKLSAMADGELARRGYGTSDLEGSAVGA